MAPREGIPILQLAEKDKRGPTYKRLRWGYVNERLQIGSLRTEGAFRAFSVEDLRKSPPVITLEEWTDLAYGKKRAKRPNNYPNYAAISHVWDPSDETLRTSEKAGRPLKIKTKGKLPTRKISWHGLVEAADAAHHLGCTYLWLDLLCIDQIPSGEKDKELQISNMANIYQNAKEVICMLGGVSAVQSLDSETSWMDRAWTLQEATVNWKRTYAYVKWPYQKDFKINSGSTSYKMKFKPVPRQSANSLMLIKLYRLLEMPPLTDTTNTTPPLDLPSGFKVVCLHGIMNTGRASYAAKNAMLSVYRGGTPELRRAGVWRAMLLRTSTHPVDIVYSVMGLFNVQLDPYREDRNVQYLFNDLARKAAATSKPDIGWLVVGGVLGSVGKLERDKKSFLIPRVPNYQLKQKPPRYLSHDQKTWKWSSQVVDDSRYGIKRYHIKFHTNSLPHIMCAVMLKVMNIKNKATLKQYKTALFTIGGKTSRCRYHGTINNGMSAMMVGTVGSWDKPKPKPEYVDWQYVMFMEWTRKHGWVLKGDGIVNGTGIDDKWVSGLRRWQFTVGYGAQKELPNWPYDDENSPIRTDPLPMSYGVLPLENCGDDVSQVPIEWFGRLGEKPSPEKWRKLQFWNSIFPEPSNKKPFRTHRLWLVACPSANPPEPTDVESTPPIYGFIYLPMEWTYVSLGIEDIDALQASVTTGLNVRTYQVAVQFTKYMIYLKSVPSKSQMKLNPHFTNTAVVSYSLNNKQEVIKKRKPGTDPYSGFTEKPTGEMFQKLLPYFKLLDSM